MAKYIEDVLKVEKLFSKEKKMLIQKYNDMMNEEERSLEERINRLERKIKELDTLLIPLVLDKTQEYKNSLKKKLDMKKVNIDAIFNNKKFKEYIYSLV